MAPRAYIIILKWNDREKISMAPRAYIIILKLERYREDYHGPSDTYIYTKNGTIQRRLARRLAHI